MRNLTQKQKDLLNTRFLHTISKFEGNLYYRFTSIHGCYDPLSKQVKKIQTALDTVSKLLNVENAFIVTVVKEKKVFGGVQSGQIQIKLVDNKMYHDVYMLIKKEG